MHHLTVIIPTRDEELHVLRAVRSVSKFATVFVVDSGSTDDTRSLATSAGATVYEQAWQGHARQKNWALDNLPIATPWVMFLDADEYVSEALASFLCIHCLP